MNLMPDAGRVAVDSAWASMNPDELFERVEASLRAADPGTHGRLARARTSVAIQVGEDPRSGVTLRCEGDGATVERAVRPAEVNIRLTAEQASRFGHGRLPLPVMLVEGEIVCSGPVRRFLAIEPMLRSLIRAISAGTADV